MFTRPAGVTPLKTRSRAASNWSVAAWLVMLGVNSAMVVPQDAGFSDFAVYPNSLNRHLRAMRGEKKRLDGNYPDDVLVDLSYYSPCLTRTLITNALDRISPVPKKAISMISPRTPFLHKRRA